MRKKGWHLRLSRETLRELARDDHGKVAAATQIVDTNAGEGCVTFPTVTWSVQTTVPQQCCGLVSGGGISCTG